MILSGQEKVRGLTTAAEVWFAAALGMAVDVRAYLLAVVSTGIVAFLMYVMRPVSKFLTRQGRRLPVAQDD